MTCIICFSSKWFRVNEKAEQERESRNQSLLKVQAGSYRKTGTKGQKFNRGEEGVRQTKTDRENNSNKLSREQTGA